MHEPTHASFFSGVGGLDLGLERAGWRTVSFSEIDPYASAVLAERWPGVPNLGDIVALADGWRGGQSAEPADLERWGASGAGRATLWTGGFPCQDLSVAGKRRGMVEGTRSNLAHAFLDLVERHRPPAVLLENVPGLLSSHRGRDMAALVGRLAELGYGVAYRVLDARHFGVPQRRRRVFILGLRSGPDDPSGRLAAERAAAVLAVGSRCPRHPATGGEAGADASDGTSAGAVLAREGKQAGHNFPEDHLVGALNDLGHHGWTANAQSVASGHVIPVSPPPNPGGVRAADGLAGRLDDRELALLHAGTNAGDVARALSSVGGGNDYGANKGNLVAYVKDHNVSATDGERWTAEDRSMNAFDGSRTSLVSGSGVTDDPLLPLGLDSHRYRCCGNGVVAPVSEWLGRRLFAELAA